MVELKFITSHADKLIEEAGRICYASESKGQSGKFVMARVKEGHLSLGRHAHATFKVSCSRACAMQWLRSKFLEFTMRSQRYCNEGDFEFIIPPSIDYEIETMKNHNEYLGFVDIIHKIKEAYKELIRYGVKKEDARYVLPNACLTEFYVTGNFQAWYDFIKLRTDPYAQWEIREQAKEIAGILSGNSCFFYEFKEE